MRSCDEIELLINLYLDDMLSPQEIETLQAHLRECPACSERYAELREIKQALCAMEEPVPEDLHDRIMTYVSENTAQKKEPAASPAKILRPRRWYRALATVAACAVIAVATARFVPNVTEHTDELLRDALQGENVSQEAPESMVDSIPDEKAPAQSEATEGNNVFFRGETENTVPPAESSPPMADGQTGQMAEDLPPLRQQNNADAEKPEASVAKWLKAEGKREKLPDWVDPAFVYETELDGITVSYVEIASWAEDYWTEQLQACDFILSEMEGKDLVSDGEYILLFFFWTE